MGSKNGPRHVAIAIAVRIDENKTGRERVLGGVEAGESERAAAARELDEEAGVSAPMDRPPWCTDHGEPITIRDSKPHAKSPTSDPNDPAFIPHTLYSVHEFLVPDSACKETWLESNERVRHWVSWDEACERVQWRRGMGEAMQRAALRTSTYLPPM
ncbi:diphosphoinositol-polyphosphate diphosphatase [Malassezia caprae]|uniref:Diphosphoinositol-polyphosphate diphosphatase n=1 Tax=Malassezia caprae TaxID=1381934 RepID=A0AAF0E611_9BASI|nr:diphosphoinositol-polyphosphate diphosphatase [Malassezia caprae]